MAFILHPTHRKAKLGTSWIYGARICEKVQRSVSKKRGSRVCCSLLVPASRIVTAVGVHVGWVGLALKFGEKYLTPAGVLHSGLLGTLLWLSMGFPGWLVTAAFFVIGSTVTKVGLKIKEKEGTAEKRSGARGPENVWGAAGPAALCALFVLLVPALPIDIKIRQVLGLLGRLGYSGAIATKAADTVSSEIGKAFGRTTVLLTNLRTVPRGTEGAVSLEGTFAGVLASLVIALLAWYVMLVPYLDIPVIVLAAFFANIVESIIGSTLQGKMNLSNELVNVINTSCGAIFSILIRIAFTAFNVFY